MLLISAALVDNLAEKVDQQVSDIMTKIGSLYCFCTIGSLETVSIIENGGVFTL